MGMDLVSADLDFAVTAPAFVKGKVRRRNLDCFFYQGWRELNYFTISSYSSPLIGQEFPEATVSNAYSGFAQYL